MFHWDTSVNVGNVVSIVVLICTTINYGRKVLGYLTAINFRVNIMWRQFEHDHPEYADFDDEV